MPRARTRELRGHDEQPRVAGAEEARELHEVEHGERLRGGAHEEGHEQQRRQQRQHGEHLQQHLGAASNACGGLVGCDAAAVRVACLRGMSVCERSYIGDQADRRRVSS